MLICIYFTLKIILYTFRCYSNRKIHKILCQKYFVVYVEKLVNLYNNITFNGYLKFNLDVYSIVI